MTSAVLGPFIGRWVDKHGHRVQLSKAYLVIVSIGLITLALASFMAIPDCSGCYWGIFGFGLLGLGFAIYASVIWPSVPFTVPEQSSGTAFGVVTSFQNTGMFAGPLMVGVIVDGTTFQHGYFWALMLLVTCGILGLFTCLALWWVDYKSGNSLTYPNPLLVRRRPSSTTESPTKSPRIIDSPTTTKSPETSERDAIN